MFSTNRYIIFEILQKEMYTCTDPMPSNLTQKIEKFFSRFTKKVLKKGSILIDAEETPEEAFYLKKGYVREYALSPQGVELTLHIFAPGSYFPMLAIISKTKNRYFYETITPAELYIIPKEELVNFLKKEPDVVLDLSRRLLLGLDKLILRIENLTNGNAKLKIISALLFLSRHFGEKKGNVAKLNEAFTHRDIASLAEISRETASRELEKLQKEKAISYLRHKITINNIKAFQKMVSSAKE